MGFASQLGAGSIRTLDAAAVWRRAEAELLETGGRYTAAIYLFGYVAEIRLTAACYRVVGFDVDDTITDADREAEVAEARRLNLMTRQPHDLNGWSNYLQHVRASTGSRLGRGFAEDLTARVADAADNWLPRLRYKVAVPSAAQFKLVRDSAAWLTEHYNRFWS